MKCQFLILIIMTSGLRISFAQNYETNPDLLKTKNWYFGYGIGMTFEKDSILIDTSFKGWNYEGTAILNDKYGKLKYYSDGKFLYNSNNQIVNKNEWLRADNSSCQGIVLFESAIDSNKIHILTTSPTYSKIRKGYRYSIYDESTDSFIIINKSLVTNIGEKQAVINHQNNKSIWISTHSLLNDTFYNFLFHIDALACCPVVNKIGENYKDRFPSQGTLKFSADGSMCFNMNWNLLNYHIYNFSSEFGQFQSIFSIPVFYPYASEYDLKNKALYVVNRGTNVFKYSLQYLNVDSVQISKDTILTVEKEILGMPLIGMDSKLYISRWMDSVINRIELNNQGLSQIELKGKMSLGGLPNFNASYFYTPSIDFAYTEDCWEHKYSFEGRDTIKASSWKWFFRKNNFIDSILTKHCDYQFLDTGLWQVSHIATNSNRTDTVTKTLTIYSKWQKDILGNDTFYCQGIKPKFVLKSPPNMHCIHWNGEEPNLDEERGPIIEYNHFHKDSLVIDTAGIYYVKITNKTFCENWDTIKIEEKPKPIKPIISFNTGELASTIVAKEYRWYINDTFLFKTTQRSFKPNKNGYYQLKIISEFGCESEWSDSLKIDLSNIETITNDNHFFKIYPNPNQGYFNIKVVNPGVYQIEITDLNGKLILAEKAFIQKNRVMEIELSKGSYIVNLIDSNLNKQSKQLLVD